MKQHTFVSSQLWKPEVCHLNTGNPGFSQGLLMCRWPPPSRGPTTFPGSHLWRPHLVVPPRPHAALPLVPSPGPPPPTSRRALTQPSLWCPQAVTLPPSPDPPAAPSRRPPVAPSPGRSALTRPPAAASACPPAVPPRGPPKVPSPCPPSGALMRSPAPPPLHTWPCPCACTSLVFL